MRSYRHRLWGYHVPAMDIDFLMIEYDRAKVVALVDYKHEAAAAVDFKSHNWRAIIDLGDRAGVPVFCVYYAGDFSWWSVSAANVLAGDWVSGEVRLTEAEYIRLMYRIRRRIVPPSPFDGTSELLHQ